jgi:hypothetical protein
MNERLAFALLTLLAPAAMADGTGVHVAYSKDLYAINEQVDLHITGAPGTIGFVLFDIVPGPTDVPGVGTLGVGLSPWFNYVVMPAIPASGDLLLCCDFDCDSTVPGNPVYTQVVSIDFAALALCISNVDVLDVQDLYGVCGEGCTPGYWKNHVESWAATGVSRDADFDATFGTDAFSPDLTLEQVITTQPGVLKNLPYHGVAALLNASSPDVDYFYTPEEVIDMVSYGLNSGDEAEMEAVKNLLALANESNCVL